MQLRKCSAKTSKYKAVYAVKMPRNRSEAASGLIILLEMSESRIDKEFAERDKVRDIHSSVPVEISVL